MKRLLRKSKSIFMIFDAKVEVYTINRLINLVHFHKKYLFKQQVE